MAKVLITGAGGFIGSHLVEMAVENNYEVKAFVHYNANNRWGWLDSSEYRNDIEVLSGDIRDYDSVYNAIKGCDIIFHLAALIGIPYSYVSPLAYIRTNVEGTYNILQASRELGLKNVIITSTSETYGTAQYVPIDEKHPKQGQSPYSATKISADQISLSYYLAFNLPVKIVRPFNTYGPRQSARAVIPTIITQLLSGVKEIQLGALSPSRDFVFVKDTVKAFIEIAKSDRAIGEEINIATQNDISIGELAQEIIDMINPEAQIIQDKERVRPGKSEVNKLLGSNNKLKKLTNWKPEYSLKKGLADTIEWFRKNNSSYKSNLYNV